MVINLEFWWISFRPQELNAPAAPTVVLHLLLCCRGNCYLEQIMRKSISDSSFGMSALTREVAWQQLQAHRFVREADPENPVGSRQLLPLWRSSNDWHLLHLECALIESLGKKNLDMTRSAFQQKSLHSSDQELDQVAQLMRFTALVLLFVWKTTYTCETEAARYR